MVAQVLLPNKRLPTNLSELPTDRLQTLQSLLMELCLREMSPLAIYEPLPHQLAFHKSQAFERVIFGSNRAGKTIALSMELAWAITGTHPYRDYPKEGGTAFLVGKDSKHLGGTLWPYLYRRKPTFRMIRDLETNRWRTWRETNPQDLARKSESVPMLPMIDQRLIKDIAWDKKAAGIPELIKLHNGWEVHFLSAKGEPPRGADIDICGLDEEIRNEEWYPEMSARLIDRGGALFWGATQQSGTLQLADLIARGMEEVGTEKPLVEVFFGLQKDNAFISDEKKERFRKKLVDNPEQYKIRWEGQALILSFLMYQNFSMVTHGCEFFEIPSDWTRYLSIDPGNQVACGLFFAVPPPGAKKPDGTDAGDCVYLYDEVYQRDTDVFRFAAAVKHKTDGVTFEAFLIDDHGSRKAESTGKTIYQQYAEEFARQNITSVATGNGFRNQAVGNDGLEAGCEQVRAWLRNRDTLGPKLRILNGTCPNTIKDMQRYHRKRDAHGNVTDKPDGSRNSHGPDCVRYMAMHGAAYVKPSILKRVGNWVNGYLKAKKSMSSDGESNSYVHLGSGV